MYERLKRRFQKFINVYHFIKAVLANIFYGFPSKKLKVIGVTGTDGKTTTSFLIYHILKEAGKKVSMTSSIYANIGGDEFSTGLHVTTPDVIYMQKLLKKAGDHNDEYFILETTSHALDQNRVAGIRFEIGVITNITSEHLDYHKTRENYVKATAKLLLQSKKSVINRDDTSYELLFPILKNKTDYSIDLNRKLNLSLADFNNYNYLAAYTTTKLLGVQEEEILKALKTFKLPKGRIETVYDKEFKVIIDFAHTENSLRQVLKSIKRNTKGRLIHVFGAAGLRDHVKRPGMGCASGASADVTILTEEDYRTEDPEKICIEIAAGLETQKFEKVEKELLDKTSRKKYSVIINREGAIKRALEIATRGDVIVLTGKSHEKSLARGNREYPYNEEETVRILLDLIKA